MGAVFVGLAYAYGLVLGGLSLLWTVVTRDDLPTWAWWQWLLAPLGIGAGAMALEFLGEKLQNAGFGAEGQSRSKRVLHLFVFFLVLSVLVLGPVFYKVANP